MKHYVIVTSDFTHEAHFDPILVDGKEVLRPKTMKFEYKKNQKIRFFTKQEAEDFAKIHPKTKLVK